MNETNILQKVRLRASKLKIVLFRNNCGAYKDKTGRLIRYGLGTGTSDLVGWTPVTITQDMVGSVIAQFTVYEVKTPEGMKPSGKKAKEHFEEQVKFIDAVVRAGGKGKMICSEDALP